MSVRRRLPSLTALALSALAAPAAAAPECAGDRYVGFIPANGSSPCTGSSGGWQRTRLFADGPAELARYCVYSWVGSGAPTPSTLPSYGAGSPALDCAAVTPHAPGALELADQAALEASFRAQVEGVTSLPTSANGWTATKVVVVDSAVTSGFPNPGTGLLDHGRAMGTIVRALACGTSGPCRAIVANSLALPLVRSGTALVRQPTLGGRYGTFGDLAAAIYGGYRAAVTTAPTTAPVVINLSVGWDPALGGAYTGSSDDTLSPPIRAVFSALTYVSCQGGLVLAASGNASDGVDESSGPAYPGAWEAKPAPSPARCSPLGGVANSPSPTTNYRRMLYAVGGVDPRDRPLSTRRPQSTPSLVAQAAHATVTYGASPTRALSGSSVATAVAAAAAATAWSYLPGTSRHDVIDRLRTSAIGLPLVPALVPESCGASGCPSEVRRISVCQAIASACAGNPLCAIGGVTCPPTTTPRDARPTGLTFSVPGMVERASGPLAAPQPLPPGSPCGFTTFTGLASAPTPRCPADTFANAYAFPYSGPQPGGTICPTCTLEWAGNVLLEINPDWVGELYDPTVTVAMVDGTKPYFALDVDPSALVPGAIIKVTGTGIDGQKALAAEIQFKVVVDGDAYSSSSPLLIER